MEKKKLVVIIAIAIVAIVVVSLLVNRSVSDKELYHIGITQLMTNPGIDAIRDGFLDEMSKLGYIEGKNIRYCV